MAEKRVLTTKEAKALADTIRVSYPEKAAAIDAALAKAVKAAGAKVEISVSMRYRLEKFPGEMKPGDEPYEVIEGEAA